MSNNEGNDEKKCSKNVALKINKSSFNPFMDLMPPQNIKPKPKKIKCLNYKPVPIKNIPR